MRGDQPASTAGPALIAFARKRPGKLNMAKWAKVVQASGTKVD